MVKSLKNCERSATTPGRSQLGATSARSPPETPRCVARSAALVAEQFGIDPALAIDLAEALDGSVMVEAAALPPVDPRPAVLFRHDVVEHHLVTDSHAADELSLGAGLFPQGHKPV